MAVEEKQLHDKAMEDGCRQWAGQCGVGCSLFSFLGGDESYLQSYPLFLPKMGGNFCDFGGVIFATFEVRFGLVGLGVGLGVILWSFLVILPPILS